MILGDDTYYVSSPTTKDCPQPCHPLSHYINNTATYFTSNATFIFMEGEHLFESKGDVNDIVITSSLTLRGKRGHSDNDTIIKCSSNANNLIFNYGTVINIYGIIITGCGKKMTINRSVLLITDSIFTNNNGLRIHVRHGNLTITNSTFTNNRIFIYSGTGANNKIAIADSIFTNDNGFGLDLSFDNRNPNRATPITYSTIAITNNVFAGCTQHGLYISYGTGASNNILTLTNNTFTANKQGLTVTSGTNTYNNITITNGTFTTNEKGLDIVSGTDEKNNITIINSKFTNNDGYGLCIHVPSTTCCYAVTDKQSNIVITNTTFDANQEGLFTAAHVDVAIANGTFINNRGSGLHVSYPDYFTPNLPYRMTVTSSTFANNDNGLQIYVHPNVKIYDNDIAIIDSNFTNNDIGILGYTHDYQLKLSRVVISNNKRGILSYSACKSRIVFTDGLSIIANNSSPDDGGGIYLGKGSYLSTKNGNICFINNTAQRYGGAIYSSDNDYRPNKFSGTHNSYKDGCTVDNKVSATFINNSALKAGDILYGGEFTACERSAKLTYETILRCSCVPKALKSASRHNDSIISSDPLLVCPCINGSVDCAVRSIDREVYPGQIFNVSLVTVGLCGGVSPGYIAVKHESHISLVSTADYANTSCTTFNYTVKLTTYTARTTLNMNVADGDMYNSDIGHINVTLSILPCPLGLVLDPVSGECVCNISGVVCNTSWMPYPIKRSGNNWIAHQYDEHNCTIAHTGCPFDYCNTSPVKFNLNESDLQCNYNRSGVLCGKCIQGLSLMMGSNRCANCTNTTLVFVSIFILAAVAGIVLVAILIVLNLTVSIGSINGLLFYVNLVKLNESVFFPHGNIPVITQFISWCNLDMGFEYCFIDGLDGYVKTWLQFVFPLYVWFLVIVIIVGCRYSGRLCRICGRNAVPVLATLILISYTKLSRAVTNALMINTLQCDDNRWSVWNVDGNIHYLSGKHIALFTVSLLFLVTGLVYTGLVFSSQWLQRYSGKCCKSTRDPVVRLKPLIDAYTGPFKDSYRFWTGLCLIVRLILTVVFAFTTTLQSKLNNYIILLMVGAMSYFITFVKVYKAKHLIILEILSYMNIICLSILTILFTDESYRDIVSIDVVVSVSVSVEILLFVIIVIVHCYLALKNSKVAFSRHCNTHIPFEEDLLPVPMSRSNDDKEGSPARVVTYREDLIFDFNLKKQHPTCNN